MRIRKEAHKKNPSKMTRNTTLLSILTLNVNGLSSSQKTEWQFELKSKT
jgi:hypothetical protein